MEITLLFGNYIWAGSALDMYGMFAAAPGIAGLLANGVSLNMVFAYFRKGCNLRKWKFVVLVLLAAIPIVPMPLDFELVFFFSPFLSLLIAGCAVLLTLFSPVDDRHDLWMYDHSGHIARASALAIISFTALAASVVMIPFLLNANAEVYSDVVSLGVLLGLAYAAVVFRNIRAVSVWSLSYMIQLAVMIAMIPMSLAVQILYRF